MGSEAQERLSEPVQPFTVPGRRIDIVSEPPGPVCVREGDVALGREVYASSFLLLPVDGTGAVRGDCFLLREPQE